MTVNLHLLSDCVQIEEFIHSIVRESVVAHQLLIALTLMYTLTYLQTLPSGHR